MPNRIYFADNLPVLQSLPDGVVDLIYIDPPFNTGKTQSRTQIRAVRAPEVDRTDSSGDNQATGDRTGFSGRPNAPSPGDRTGFGGRPNAPRPGDRTGFGGRRYDTVKIGQKSYADLFDDYLAFLAPRLEEAYRVLSPRGALYFHIDYREAHYCKVLLDTIFGRDCFLNEIIWAYDYGGKAKTKWPPKHDTIFFYVKDPRRYTFNVDDIEREPYMAPGLVGPEKAARGKLPTDTWWHTIVATNGAEKTGYPTQKPLGVINRIVRASSNPGELVMDFFAGSGTVGASCLALGRRFLLVDNNPQAIAVMRSRFAGETSIEWLEGQSPPVAQGAPPASTD